MLFDKTNIETQLAKRKLKALKSNEMLEQVYHILNNHQQNKKRIAENIFQSKKALSNDFTFDLLETDRLYHIDQIKSVCIDYRLRFLDSKYFKGVIPQEALSKIEAMEKEHQIEIKGFKIVAPSKLFKLEDKDDPLLFAPIGNDYFYLIHKWGNDLSPFRKMAMWPFKNVSNLLLVIFVISFLATLLVPNGLFSKNSSGIEFLVILFFMLKSIIAVVIFYGYAMGKNFNPAIWNSKYFNA
jgi:hypothetical protein